MNKKADEKILSLWWFLCLCLVAVVIITAVVIYFNKSIDVREKEISSLSQKIKDCLVKNGFIFDVREWSEEDFFKNCGLNEKRFNEKSELFFNLTITNQKGDILKKIRVGAFNYEEDCLLRQKTRNYPECILSKDNFLFFNESSGKKEIWTVNLIIASQNYGEKISITK